MSNRGPSAYQHNALPLGQSGSRFTSTETAGLLGTGARDVHLDFHTAPEALMFAAYVEVFCFTSTETAGLLGTGARDVHLDIHTAPQL